MSPVFQGLLIFGAILMAYFIMKKIRQSKLQIEYAIFWIIFSGILLIFSIFPFLVAMMTRAIGMELPVNFIFLLFILILILKAFFQTIETSALENKVRNLTQRLAIEEKERQEELSAMKNPRKVLGYQIHDDNGEFPDGLFSFMVFKTRADAESYMLVEDLTGFDIHEYYEGDIEAPTFIGMRIFRKGERVFNCEQSLMDSDLRDWAVVCKDTVAMYADQIVLLKMEDGIENETDSHSIYQIAEGKVCPRCGGPLCVEHDEDVDYPYYCPECDENFYDCEV